MQRLKRGPCSTINTETSELGSASFLTCQFDNSLWIDATSVSHLQPNTNFQDAQSICGQEPYLPCEAQRLIMSDPSAQ